MDIKKIIDGFISFLKPEKSLKKKTVSSIFWIIFLRCNTFLLGFFKTILLARLLSPSDFGLMALALTVITSLEAFSRVGVETKLIQEKENIKKILDTGFTILALKGIFIFLVMFFGAEYIGIFFENKMLIPLIQVLALTALFRGFFSIKTIYFKKNLEYHKYFTFEFSGFLVDLIVTIILALIFKNVWALIIGNVAGYFIRLVISYILAPYIPRFDLKLDNIKEIWGYGKWIFVSSTLMIGIMEFDKIVIGKLLGSSALGIYHIAYRLTSYSYQFTSKGVHAIFFSLFAKLQDKNKQLKEAFKTVLFLQSLIYIPLNVAVIVMADDFVKIFLGQKWLETISVIKILALYIVVKSTRLLFCQFFNAKGKPKNTTIINVIHFIVLLITIFYLTTTMGIVGTAYSMLISTFISLLVSIFYIFRELDLKFVELMNTFKLPLICSLILAANVYIFKYFYSNISLLEFICMILFTISSYTLILILLEKYTDIKIFKTIKDILL